MDLQIRGNDITISESLREFAQLRTAKLDRLVDRVVEAKLELRKRHQRSGGDITIAQFTIQTGRHVLRAEEHDHDPRRAIDDVVDTMTRQIRRYHDKRTDRQGARPEAVPEIEPAQDETVEFDGDDLEQTAGIVRTKRFSLKPMGPEEAIEQMELLGHDFYFFLNADESQHNVLYRREDGSYGLLAPERP